MNIEVLAAWLSLLPIALVIDSVLSAKAKTAFVVWLRTVHVTESAAFVSKVLDRIFGPKLFSWRAIGTVTALTTALWLLLSIATYAISPGGREAIDEVFTNGNGLQWLAVGILLLGTILADFLSYAQTRLFVRAADRANNIAVAWVFTIADIFVSVALFIFSFAAAGFLIIYIYAAQNVDVQTLQSSRYAMTVASELAEVDFEKFDADKLVSKSADSLEHAYMAYPALLADFQAGRRDIPSKFLNDITYTSRIGFSWEEAPAGAKRFSLQAPGFYEVGWSVECKPTDNYLPPGMNRYFYELNSANWLALLASRATKGVRKSESSPIESELFPPGTKEKLSDTSRIFTSPNAEAIVSRAVEQGPDGECIRVVVVDEKYSVGRHIFAVPAFDLYAALARRAAIADMDSIAARFQIYSSFELSEEILPLLSAISVFRAYGETQNSPAYAKWLEWSVLATSVHEDAQKPWSKIELPKLYLPFSTLALIALFPSAIFLVAMVGKAGAVAANSLLDIARGHQRLFKVDKYPLTILTVVIVASCVVMTLFSSLVFGSH